MNVIRERSEAIRDDIASAAEAASARTGQTADDVGAKASAATEAALREINNLVDSLTERVKALGVDTNALSDKARASASAVEKTIMREVTDRPLRAFAVAGLIGLAIGALSRK